MRTKNYMVNLMLMSIVTAAISISFTACSDELDTLNETAPAAAKTDGEALEAVGLMFNDFIHQNDVQILNADTTLIAINKAFADKKGINNFVNRPMGIWLTFRERSFLRRGLSQRLEGDRYIVEVADATIEEVLQPGRDLTLKTGLFVNPEAAEQTKTRGASMEMSSMMEELLTDDEGCLHPAAIQFLDESVTRSGMSNSVNYSPLELLGMMEENGAITRGFWDDLWEGIKRGVSSAVKLCFDPFGVNEAFLNAITDGEKPGNYGNTLVNIKSTQTFTKKFQCGKYSEDTITVKAKMPIEFYVNYVLNLKVGGTKFTPRMDYFRGYIDGEFKAAPELTVGFSKKVELPKDMQKIKITDFPSVSVTFTPYGIPINITFKPSAYFKLKATGEGYFYAGIKYEYDAKFRAGAEYKNSEWNNLSYLEPIKDEFSFIPPTANFKFTGGIGVMLGCDIIFEKVAGPSIAAGPQIGLTLDLKVAPTAEKPVTFKGEAKLGFWGEVGAKVSIWKWDMIDYYHDIDFGLSKQLWSYDYPKDIETTKDLPITKLLNAATEGIKNVQDMTKEQIFGSK